MIKPFPHFPQMKVPQVFLYHERRVPPQVHSLLFEEGSELDRLCAPCRTNIPRGTEQGAGRSSVTDELTMMQQQT